MNYQEKKADPVGIGLLKEGDDAYHNFNSRPIGRAFMNGPLCALTYIDAARAKKLHYFPKIPQNWQKTAFRNEKANPFGRRPLFWHSSRLFDRCSSYLLRQSQNVFISCISRN
jgi:hypothetical protein